MRKFLNQITGRLRDFVDQRDDVALVLTCPDTDGAPLLKIFEGLEESSRSDFYWSFTDAFADAGAYADSIVTTFEAKHKCVRLAMEKQGMKPWPMLPEAIGLNQLPPAERLRGLAAFSRSLLPVPNGGNSVWIFFPLEIGDHIAFAKLMEAVLQHDFPFPWCHNIRFIIREDPGAPQPIAAELRRVQRYQPDLGMDAVNRALEEEVADETLPLQERMAYLPVMAGNDFAQSRFAAAMEKYELLLRYHAPAGNYAMAAFALNGMGEVYERTGDLERANQSFEAALVPATQGEHKPITVLLNIVINLGNLCMRQERWEHGEGWFDAAQQLATAARDPTTKISSLEKLGVCQKHQGRNDDAVRSWRDGVGIAAQLEDSYSCRNLLVRLEQHYASLGDNAGAREVQHLIADLEAPVSG